MLGKAVSRLILRARGWTLEGSTLEEPHVVVLAVPHTSNWDLLDMLCMSKVLGFKVAWMGKKALFKGLKGRVLRRLGGFPVDREAPGGVVAAMAAEMERRPRFALVIPPAGTRSRREYWRSGFYHIARGADVPVALSYLDYSTKRGGIGPTFRLTGDIPADMARIREFYQGMTGRYPDKVSVIRLKEEDQAAAA